MVDFNTALFKIALEAVFRGALKLEVLMEQVDKLLTKSPQTTKLVLIQLDEAHKAGSIDAQIFTTLKSHILQFTQGKSATGAGQAPTTEGVDPDASVQGQAAVHGPKDTRIAAVVSGAVGPTDVDKPTLGLSNEEKRNNAAKTSEAKRSQGKEEPTNTLEPDLSTSNELPSNSWPVTGTDLTRTDWDNPASVATTEGPLALGAMILVRHSQSNEASLRNWIHQYKKGLLPYAGAWRTPEEIIALRRRTRRRSAVIFVELLGVLIMILLFDLFLFAVLQQMFS